MQSDKVELGHRAPNRTVAGANRGQRDGSQAGVSLAYSSASHFMPPEPKLT